MKKRLKILENKLSKIQKRRTTKIWIINVSSAKSKRERKMIIKRKKQDIINGKVPNYDGTYFSEKDRNIIVITAVPRPKTHRQN